MARRWAESSGRKRLADGGDPFEAPLAPDRMGVTRMGWQLVFSSGDAHLAILVAFEVGPRLERLKDQELIALLDAARETD